MGGNTPCRAKASESSDPFFTSSRTALMCGASLASVRRSDRRSSAFKIGSPGANQRDELLVEDQELLQVDLFLAAAHRHAGNLAARLDGIDQEALLGKPVAQFPFRAGFGHLLVHFAARVGVLENEFRHYSLPSASTRRRAGRHLELEQGVVHRRIDLLAVQLEREKRHVLDR